MIMGLPSPHYLFPPKLVFAAHREILQSVSITPINPEENSLRFLGNHLAMLRSDLRTEIVTEKRPTDFFRTRKGEERQNRIGDSRELLPEAYLGGHKK
jgi:hypothetical protein